MKGERWKALGPEAKRPFELKAEEDKARHAAEMEAYKASDAYARFVASSE